MEALGKNVIIKPIIEKEEVTASGLILIHKESIGIDKAPDTPFAEVVSVGPDVKGDVEVGDKVIYNRFAAKSLGPEFEEYRSINVHEIYGKVT